MEESEAERTKVEAWPPTWANRCGAADIEGGEGRSEKGHLSSALISCSSNPFRGHLSAYKARLHHHPTPYSSYTSTRPLSRVFSPTMASPAPAPPAPSPPPPATLLDYTLRTAPVNVVLGTFSCSKLVASTPFASLASSRSFALRAAALGAITGSALGIIRNYPAIPAAFKTGVNTGVFSFTFFSSFPCRRLPARPSLTSDLTQRYKGIRPTSPPHHSPPSALSSRISRPSSSLAQSPFLRPRRYHLRRYFLLLHARRTTSKLPQSRCDPRPGLHDRSELRKRVGSGED